MDGQTDKFVKDTDGYGKVVTALIVGAGCRGHTYSAYGLCEPNKFKVVGVCDPRQYHRNIEIMRHQIPPENRFTDWQEAVGREKFADCVVICTQDRLHKAPAVAFAKKGYHILLEKPMATTESDCREIVETCKKNNIILLVCHVLRYTPWVKTVMRIIKRGEIGRVININHTEPLVKEQIRKQENRCWIPGLAEEPAVAIYDLYSTPGYLIIKLCSKYRNLREFYCLE